MGGCPKDKPDGVTATPQCALSNSATGDKYCVLICHEEESNEEEGEDEVDAMKKMAPHFLRAAPGSDILVGDGEAIIGILLALERQVPAVGQGGRRRRRFGGRRHGTLGVERRGIDILDVVGHLAAIGQRQHDVGAGDIDLLRRDHGPVLEADIDGHGHGRRQCDNDHARPDGEPSNAGASS